MQIKQNAVVVIIRVRNYPLAANICALDFLAANPIRKRKAQPRRQGQQVPRSLDQCAIVAARPMLHEQSHNTGKHSGAQAWLFW
jgi:hypothetical protein